MQRKNFIKLSSLAFGGLTLASLTSCNSNISKPETKTSIPAKPKIVTEGQGKKLNVIGDNQLIKLIGEDTNNQFTLIEQHNAPGIGIPPHIHENEDEVFTVNSGKVEITIGEKTKILNAGDLVYCPRGIPHSWKVIGTENAKITMSVFPSGIEKMFEELSNLPKGKPDLVKVGEICGKYKVTFV